MEEPGAAAQDVPPAQEPQVARPKDKEAQVRLIVDAAVQKVKAMQGKPGLSR